MQLIWVSGSRCLQAAIKLLVWAEVSPEGSAGRQFSFELIYMIVRVRFLSCW